MSNGAQCVSRISFANNQAFTVTTPKINFYIPTFITQITLTYFTQKELFLKSISSETDISKKIDLAAAFIKDNLIPFTDLVWILKPFQNPYELHLVCEKANLKDYASIKKIINEKALEAVEFSLKSGFLDEYRKINESIDAQYGAELKRLKGEADAASKAKDEGAKRKNEKYQELLAKN